MDSDMSIPKSWLENKSIPPQYLEIYQKYLQKAADDIRQEVAIFTAIQLKYDIKAILCKEDGFPHPVLQCETLAAIHEYIEQKIPNKTLQKQALETEKKTIQEMRGVFLYDLQFRDEAFVALIKQIPGLMLLHGDLSGQTFTVYVRSMYKYTNNLIEECFGLKISNIMRAQHGFRISCGGN